MAATTYEVVWSDRAIADLRDIVTHMAEDSPAAAYRLVDRIEATVDRLRFFPLSGRVVPERRRRPNPPREVIVGNYRVVYDASDDTVSILTVFHGRRKAEEVLSRLD